LKVIVCFISTKNTEKNLARSANQERGIMEKSKTQLSDMLGMEMKALLMEPLVIQQGRSDQRKLADY
jgi:hypothetical protein